MNEDFCLKWNDHHAAFFSNAEDLCASHALCDVTLSCGNKEFSAHKLVLAVSSGYFATLFTRRHVEHAREIPYMPTQVCYVEICERPMLINRRVTDSDAD